MSKVAKQGQRERLRCHGVGVERERGHHGDAILATCAQSSFVSTAINSVGSGLDLKFEHHGAAQNAHHAREGVNNR